MIHYYNKNQISFFKKKKISANIRGNLLEFFTGTGVFAKRKIDKGTLLLANKAIINDNWKILDLGCGYGAIGIAIAKSNSSVNVIMSDINKRAVMLAKENILLNKIRNASVIHSDLFQNINEKFDSILLNPPQSAGRELCIKMITESKDHLLSKGLFQMVARHKIGGKELEKKMLQIFGNVKQIAKKSGYRIYVSVKE
ncbi:MAG: methyltransferase [Candidatus Pacearchaeota archaeon]